MKKRKFILIAVIFFSIILYLWSPFQSGFFEEDFTTLNNNILVVAHRGSHELVPENSLAAIQQSIDSEIDYVELDVRTTLDRNLVILHDNDLDRTTTGSGEIGKQNLRDVKQYFLRFGNKISSEKVPTLEEALLKAKGNILVNLDLKVTDTSSLKKIYQLIEKFEMEESVILSINDLKLIPELRKQNESIQIMPVVNTGKKLKKALDMAGIRIVQIKQQSIPPVLLDKLEKKEIRIWRNALKKYDRLELQGEDGFKKLVTQYRVHIIQTDHPEKLLKFLRENELHQ
jgi:glycerophosphoryl diester phosphodiesterase